MSDQQLLNDYAESRRESAFAELVRRRQATVRGLLRKLSRDAALADDLAQETFVQAWRTLAQLRNAGAFGGWLKQVAVRVWFPAPLVVLVKPMVAG